MRRTCVSARVVGVALVAAACALAAPAFAQVGQAEEGVPSKWATGIRGGAGLNNTEGVVAFLWQSPAMGPAKYLRFRPAINAGFSSGQFAVGMNLDVVASMKIPGSAWSLLFGGGVSVFGQHASGAACINVPGQGCIGGGGATNGVVGSHEILVGFQQSSGLFGEVRAVSGLNHGTEVVVGYFFKK